MAKKDVSAIVSGMGLGSSIIDSIIKMARKEGLEDRVIHSLGALAGEKHLEALIRSMMGKVDVPPSNIIDHKAVKLGIEVKVGSSSRFRLKSRENFEYDSEYQKYLSGFKEESLRSQKEVIRPLVEHAHRADDYLQNLNKKAVHELYNMNFPFWKIIRAKDPQRIYLVDFRLPMSVNEALQRLSDMGLAPSEWLDLVTMDEAVGLALGRKPIFALGSSNDDGFACMHRTNTQLFRLRNNQTKDCYHKGITKVDVGYTEFDCATFPETKDCRLLAYPIQ